MEHFFAKENPPFHNGSLQHLLTVLFFTVLIVGIIYWARRSWSEERKISFFKVLGWTTFSVIVLWTIAEIALGRWDWVEDLPVVICNLMAFAAPLFTLTRNPKVFDAVYYYIFGTTLQAVITPDLQEGFLNYIYIKFWVVHFGVIMIGLYAIFVLGMRPRGWKSVLWAVGWLSVYVVFMYILNLIFGANYFYLSEKPPMATILDYLGPWPIYIFVGIAIVIPYFALLYLPFAIRDRVRKGKVVA